eukprot:SAG11_NODE_6381_length_1325_cov_1.082382_2_plen_39_part_01
MNCGVQAAKGRAAEMGRSLVDYERASKKVRRHCQCRKAP